MGHYILTYLSCSVEVSRERVRHDQCTSTEYIHSVHTTGKTRGRKMDGIVWLGKNLQEIVHAIWSNPGITTFVIGASGLVYYIWSHKQDSYVLEVPEGAVEVGKVSRVILYPVKSMKQMVEQKSLFCDHMGMRSHGGTRDR